ncbi:uncharacterized protein LOC135597407 isoform X2 [Musa acuminata AAA Group]|uniref:uncharacterized protein LOC135597407 isoform X2 n=1 Tax=Musa acuminata AAA Group TaxID=214697 RepID=UPI0031E0E950
MLRHIEFTCDCKSISLVMDEESTFFLWNSSCLQNDSLSCLGKTGHNWGIDVSRCGNMGIVAVSPCGISPRCHCSSTVGISHIANLHCILLHGIRERELAVSYKRFITCSETF